MNKIALLLLVVCLGQAYCVLNPKVVCYYDYWFVWRSGKDKFTVADLDSSLCTHIVYASLRVSYTGDIEYPDLDLMTGTGHDLAKFAAAKGHGKALASFLETSLANVAANPTTRTTFVTAVTHFLESYQFDGIVLEHPTSPYNDDYVSLLHELRLQFGTKYTLGVTVGSTPGTYKAANVNKFVDFYAVQTFDYHGTWEMVVGHEAPINSVVTTMKAWVDAGAEPDKLLATIPMYARTWILAGADTLPGAKAQAAGLPGPWTQVAGKLGYNELCMAMEAAPAEWEVHPDTSVDAIYAVNKVSHTWVTFESPLTTKMKTNNITASGYGGIVAQPLENDDYGNYCAQGRYPLLKGINDGLDTSTVTHAPPASSTTPVHVTPPPNQICQKTGTVRDPKDCNVYHKCTEFLPGVISDDVEHCAKGEAFDEKDLTCKDHTLVAGC